MQFKRFAAVAFCQTSLEMDTVTACLARREFLRHATELRSITEQPALDAATKAHLRSLAARSDEQAEDCETWIEVLARNAALAPSLDRSPPFSPVA